MANQFLNLLKEKTVLLADGATGTNLFSMGLQSGDAPELWNIDFPDRVAKHYRSFIDAGSDIVLTNSFGGTKYRLKLHNAQSRVTELNKASAEILAEEIDKSGKQVAVAGSIGPTGEILAPNGELSIEQARDAFIEQGLALKEGGADVLWIETISSIEESHASVQAAAEVGLPTVLTLSVDTNGRTMMGVTPKDIVDMLADLPIPLSAVGVNCGLGAAEVLASIVSMQNASTDLLHKPALVANGNCGIPEWMDGEICYSGTPELMADYVKLCMDSGVKIIGGCCGTTPKHIRAMRQAMDTHIAGETPNIESIVETLGEVTAGAQSLLQGETNSCGCDKKREVTGRRTSARQRRRRA